MTPHQWIQGQEKYMWVCARCDRSAVADVVPVVFLGDSIVACYFSADDSQPAGFDRTNIPADCDEALIGWVLES